MLLTFLVSLVKFRQFVSWLSHIFLYTNILSIQYIHMEYICTCTKKCTEVSIYFIHLYPHNNIYLDSSFPFSRSSKNSLLYFLRTTTLYSVFIFSLTFPLFTCISLLQDNILWSSILIFWCY